MCNIFQLEATNDIFHQPIAYNNVLITLENVMEQIIP